MFNRAFIILWIALFIGTAGMGMVSPLLPVFAEEMGATGIWLGLTFSGFAVSQIIVTPVVGRLSDRYGRKVFLVSGMIIFSLAALGYIFAVTYQQLVLFRLVSGIGAAITFPVAFAYVGDMAPVDREGTYMGAFNVAQMLGFGGGPLIGGILDDVGGMDVTFSAMVASTAAAALLILALLPPSSQRLTHEEQEAVPLLTLLRDARVMAVMAYYVSWALGLGAMFAFFAVFMRTELAASGLEIGIVLSSRTLLAGALQPIFGRVADRYSRPALVGGAMTCISVLIFVISGVNSLPLLLSLFLLMGLFDSIAFPAASAMIVSIGRGSGMGSIMGMFQMALSAGMISGSVIGGVIVDEFGIRAIFRYASVMALIGALIVGSIGLRRTARLSSKGLSASPGQVYDGTRHSD